MGVGDWLGQLGLRQYEKAFAENAIDAEVLQQLTAEDLNDLGVSLLGHRRKLLTAIEALRSGAEPASFAGVGGELDGQAAVMPQRRHVTVLFGNLVGSGALAASLDPEDLGNVIRRFHAIVEETVRSQDGFVAQYLSDGTLVYFGYPTAHEDDAERAVRAALLLREAVQAIEVNGMRLQARAGLASGLVVVGDRADGSKAPHEQQMMGETPNLAARLQTLAGPGEILIDTATRKLVGRMFDMTVREPACLKGFDAPVESWNVLRPGAIESRFEALRSGAAPLIGRDEELELLARRWKQAKAGSGRLVLICGEPGFGKSRLVAAFEEQVRREGQLGLRYFCSPQHRSTALYPITTHLLRAVGFGQSDTLEEKRDKLRPILAKPTDLPFIAELLGLPADAHAGVDELAPQEKRQKMLTAFLGISEALANKAPLFILIEDLHWTDPTTQELVDMLVSRIDRFPVLMILTYRPEFRPPWTGQANVTTLTLNRLSPENCATLVRILTGDQLSAEMVEEIAQRTDGIPLFAEELSKAVLDSSEIAPLKRTSSGQLQVPATLHASLIARLDHLGPEARETAQAGSVIGREFSHSLLARMIQTSGVSHSGKIESALKALIGSGLIFTRGAPPNVVYTFKHALVQDAAYSTLLRAQRQKLHAALASIMARDETVAPEVLAYHFAGAGELEQAAEYWFIAGQAANERSATSEAIRSLQNALQIISSLPETRERKLKSLEIIGALCNPLAAVKWMMPETTEMILRAGPLADELGVHPTPVIVYHQWLLAFASSNHQEGLRLAERFREVGGPELRTRACTITSNSLYISGAPLDEALEYSAKALAAYDRKLHSKQRFQYSYEPRANALANQSLQLALRGYFDQAKAAEQEGLDYAAEFNHQQTTGVLLAYRLIRMELQRDYAEREETVNSLLRHAAEHKIVFWSLWADIFRGFGKACDGATAEGIQMMDKSLKVFADMKLTYFRSVPLGMRARAYQAGGDFAHALVAADEAIAFAKASTERVMLSDLIRLSGDLHLAQSGTPAAGLAEGLFVEAVALAQAQASKLQEIRAATSLARLWLEQGRRAEAREVLYPVYSWFSEGLDSPDLIEARTVLDAASPARQHAIA